ncbi:hypothetical protein MNB_SV-6-816 [hydrothermal vent metagenome]|uniref:DUF2868 domain-containing protein n=1 Tax=hydrothermal vent metagenome TaxID=652676 RepID=A0A1W1BN61_9ZZZZ
MNRDSLSIEEYIDLQELMQIDISSHEANRKFGLEHDHILLDSTQLIKLWIEKHRYLLSTPILSQKVSRYMRFATLSMLIISLLLGIISGVALLNYSGSEPINVLYFLIATLILPITTMTLSLFAMARADRADSRLIHISPAFWMQNIILLLPQKSREIFANLHINPLLANWIVIRRSQEMALTFSIGLFLALIGVITGEDIAFGWSSTLHITPQELHHLFSLIALPWSEILPQAIPSLELIEKSHYFRLGGELSSDMIESASLLGEWWKFLAMTTLFYALFLRYLLMIWSGMRLQRAIDRATLSIDGVVDMLDEMRRPLITTEARDDEALLDSREEIEVESTPSLEEGYSVAIGWAIDSDTILIYNDIEGISAKYIYEAGGSHSLDDDESVIENSNGEVLLYVKSWEPPTMDFVDFVIPLAQKSEGVTIYPIGASQDEYKPTDKFYDIWASKISGLKLDNIKMKRASH